MLDSIRLSRVPHISVSLVLMATLGQVAVAEEPEAPEAPEAPAAEALQEITVTAQKREQSIQSVGTSITALDGAALGKLGLSDVTSLASQTPGMQFNQYSPTVTVYNLRGVSQNDFSDHQEAPIAVYADDAYIASMGALAGSMFDLARVEVLRGPQGTLFGRNATGGLIHYISEKPKFDNDGYVTATGGNFDTWNSEGALNTALTDDLAARVSFATEHHDGYVNNSAGPSVENEKQYAARVQFLYRPTDRGEILLKLHGVVNDNETGAGYAWAASHPDATGRGVLISPTSTANCPNLDGGCTPGGDITGYRSASSNPFDQALGRPGIFNRTVGGGTLHVTWNFDPFTLTSVTDYMHLQKRYGEDSGVTPVPYFVYDTLQHFQQFSQELRLNGSSAALKWIAGLYFLDYHTRNNAAVTIIPVLGGPSDAAYALTTQSEAAFGQLEYDFAESLTGIAGVRYTNDQKTFDYSYTNAPQAPVVYNETTDPTARHTFGNVSGKLELDYKLRPGFMLYGSVNRGAKGGGWSAPASGSIDTTALPYKQETLTSYELGEKATFWDGRARLNGAVFYYDYRNYQGFFLQGLTNVVENIDATVKGGELEFAWVPVRGANLQLGLSHLESRAKNVPLPAGGLTDTQMPQAPRWSVNAVARYEWSIALGRLAVEADTKWNSGQYLELVNAPADYQPSYAVSNARLTYSTADDRWEVAAWVRNLADRAYRVYGLDLSALGFEQSVYGPPRTFGATFTYRWGP
jgi:iron complex outermembrane recepter protein